MHDLVTARRTVLISSSLCLLLVYFTLAGLAQDRFRAPVERSGYSALTSYDSLRAFLSTLDGKGPIRVAPIATTRLGRAVSCCFVSTSGRFGQDSSRLRVMLSAQQHGDEPSGKEALTLLLARIANHDLDSVLSRIDLLVIPQMNPDGGELRQRRTADSIDLNRNHLLLSSPEPRGLHDLFARWQPQVTMDIHEYGPYSKSWSDSGFIKAADVQLGMLTNLNSSEALRAYQRKSVFPFVAAVMREKGFLFHEYIVGSPDDLIRYSTTEPNDGRQSFGILNTLSFIQEGRGGHNPEEDLERRATSQLASVEGLLAYCAGNAGEIRSLVSRERLRLMHAAGKPVVLCMDHFPGAGHLTIPVVAVPSGRDTVWQVRNLHDTVKALSTRDLPAGYIIPRDLSSIRELLDRHHVQYEVVSTGRTEMASVYHIDAVQPDTLEAEWHPKPSLRVEPREVFLLEGDIVVTTHQMHSLFLSILLEPESMWGLVKYPAYKFLLQSDVYPIMRMP